MPTNTDELKEQAVDSLLDQRRVVTPDDAEDFFERTRDMSPEEYSKEFEKKVSGLSGFTRLVMGRRAAAGAGTKS